MCAGGGGEGGGVGHDADVVLNTTAGTEAEGEAGICCMHIPSQRKRARESAAADDQGRGGGAAEVQTGRAPAVGSGVRARHRAIMQTAPAARGGASCHTHRHSQPLAHVCLSVAEDAPVPRRDDRITISGVAVVRCCSAPRPRTLSSPARAHLKP